jgi:hypothetical protein
VAASGASLAPERARAPTAASSSPSKTAAGQAPEQAPSTTSSSAAAAWSKILPAASSSVISVPCPICLKKVPLPAGKCVDDDAAVNEAVAGHLSRAHRC